jgi:hypothetical protein
MKKQKNEGKRRDKKKSKGKKWYYLEIYIPGIDFYTTGFYF